MKRFVWGCALASLATAGSAAEPAQIGGGGGFTAGVEWVTTPRQAVPAGKAGEARAAAASPSREGEPTRDWDITFADKTLYQALLRWGQQAGWQLIWDAERDFPVEAQVTLNGTFLTSLNSVMHSLATTDYPLQAIANPGTRVVRIVRYMDGDRR